MIKKEFFLWLEVRKAWKAIKKYYNSEWYTKSFWIIKKEGVISVLQSESTEITSCPIECWTKMENLLRRKGFAVIKNKNGNIAVV